MALVRLYYKNVNEIVGNDDVGVLMLTNEDGTRQLSMVCDKHMVYQFRLRLSKAEIIDKLLPEVLWQVVVRNLDMRFQVVINDLIDGQQIADIPVFIEETLLLRQSVPHDEKSVAVSIPVNVITTDMLKKALEKAVNEENYEQASQLRDELQRRSKSESKA